MDSQEHGSFSGGAAEIDPRPGGHFTAWNGYIRRATLELELYPRIVRSWRTTEFPEENPDSLLEILLESAPGGSRLTLIHTNIPAGQSESYRQGWVDYYFKPMESYFA